MIEKLNADAINSHNCKKKFIAAGLIDINVRTVLWMFTGF